MQHHNTSHGRATSPTRLEKLNAIQDDSHFQVLIVGGGINGIGVFNDLSLQGVKCLLVDRSDFCSGTSSAPSRMIHGGLKYMETGEFRLVRESVEERNHLLKNASHLVRPLETIIPIETRFGGELQAVSTFLGFGGDYHRRGNFVIKIGLSLYDFFSRKNRVTPKHKMMSGWDMHSSFPGLNTAIRYGASFFDAQITMPERLGVELVLDGMAANPNSIALNYCGLVKKANDKILLHDVLAKQDFEINADIVINAAGPWIDDVNLSMDDSKKCVSGAKGSHILLDLPALHDQLAGRMVYFDPGDGRICLVTTIHGKVLLGSTDQFVDSADSVKCEDDEIDYLFEALRAVYPKLSVSREHIVYTYSGVRPLPYSDQNDPAKTSRDHSIILNEATQDRAYPIFSLVGGKWTTYRAFGEEVANLVLERLKVNRKISTKDIAIGGGRGVGSKVCNQQKMIDEVTKKLGGDSDRSHQLVERYGSRAIEYLDTRNIQEKDSPISGLPDVTVSEIQFMANMEMCETVEDIVLRRLPLGLSGKLSGEIVEDIANIMAVEKGWNDSERNNRIANLDHKLITAHRVSLKTGKFSAEQES